jgi:hypothetical protein
MGEVYEVLDRDSGSRVALKLLSQLTPEALLRFKNEFRALQDIRHRNLVCLHQLLEEDGLWFFTMEFVEGVDFLRYVRPAAHGEQTSGPPTEGPTAQVPIPPQAYAASAADAPIARASAQFDEVRLRDALGQLTRSLLTLHGAGKVHRDVKPSNVLVTGEGRVVLLDFGLIVDVERNAWLTGVDQAIGTPAFMAPEQTGGGRVGPEADWYAVGSALYVALTGRVPFGGTSTEMLLEKQRREPLPPSAIVSGVPADLDALCVELLRMHPASRPTGDEVLRRLAVDSKMESRVHAEATPSHGTPFVGREREIALLEEAFAETRQGRAVVVQVHGESGVGKSALVRRFTERLAATHGAVVLSGRCYESEVVPFKAVDGIMDALTAYMAGLPGEDAAALLPLRASLLAQVFPVLRRVRTIASAPLPQQDGLDPQELRTRVFAALRELLLRLAERRPLVLVIDDLQWTDRDSLALLTEVLRKPEAPPLLLVATVRKVAGSAVLGGGGTTPAALADDVRDIRLEPLPPEEARELVALLLRSFDGGRQLDAAAIAAEGRGHPLFIDELVRHGVAGGGQQSAPLSLEEVLWARINALGEPASRILALLAVAGTPMSQVVIARAAAMDRAEFSQLLAQLRSASLVHMTGVRGSDSVQCCHDRVRAAVIAHLDPEALRRCNQSLALALEASDRADADALALHWYGAGDRERAARYATEAAAQAARALAFDRSAQLYRRALELHGQEHPSARRLKVELAEVLVNAGRGLEAAEAFLDAIPGANAAEALDLQRRAAEQFLFSGHVDRGMAALRAVLAAIGMPLPATPFRSLLSLLRSRARLRLRGVQFREHDTSQVTADELTRVDLCWTVAISLCMIDHIRGADFQTRSTLLALRAGEPSRIARALGTEMAFSAIEGGRGARRTALLHGRAEALSRRIDQPYTHGIFKGSAGVAAYLEGRWKDARDLCEQAETIVRGRVTGAAWELDTMQLYATLSRFYLGEIKELRRLLPIMLAEAAQRGDLYAATSLRTGVGAWVWLAADAPDLARQQVREAVAGWTQHGFHVQHFFMMYGEAQSDLYEGDGANTLRRIDECWPVMASAQLLRVQAVRAWTENLRARAALAEACRGGADGEALLKVASRSARRLQREKMPWTQALASMLRAGIAATRGDVENAARLAETAEQEFTATDMATFAAVARRRRGELLGDAALVAAADGWMTQQTIGRPERFAALLAPGVWTPRPR